MKRSSSFVQNGFEEDGYEEEYDQIQASPFSLGYSQVS